MKVKKSSPVDMITHLHDDLLLNCFVRLSRLFYPILSLVSKRFRSLIASLELYKTRTLLGQTESCLYVCLRFSSEPRWFYLCQRPTTNSRCLTPCFRPPIIVENTSSNNISHPDWSSRAAIGSNIYTIGERNSGALSSKVFFMDCRSHTWHEAPSMRNVRGCSFVSVLDGKIYVVPVEDWNNHIHGSSDWMEMFDPETQIWEHVPSPSVEIHGKHFVLKVLAFDEKLYLFVTNEKLMIYTPKENKWDVVELETGLCWDRFDFSWVIGNVLYCYEATRMLTWYDTEKESWIPVKGLEEFSPNLPERNSCVRLVDYGGKIALLWEENVCGDGGLKKKMIWCVEIALEWRNGQGIYGKVEWCDVVLTVPSSSSLLECITVTV